MNVLSLFDGISAGQVALKRAGIKVNNYFASEIDPYAIKITQKNFPNTIQLGDVREVKGENLPQIDLLIGGSPCTGFSFAGKQLNFNDPQSKLFFEYVRLLEECKPKYFLLENVVMKKEYSDVITKYLGVDYIKINSSLVSAQNRERLYWFGQIRKRLDSNDFVCHNCLIKYKGEETCDENRGILQKTSTKRSGEILGEAQIRQEHMQNLWKRIFEDREKGHNKNLFGAMCDIEQKAERLKKGQREEETIQQKISKRKSGKITTISKRISEDRERKGNNENPRFQDSPENLKVNENTLPQRNNRYKEQNYEKGSNKNTPNGAKVCCLWCNREYDYRSYNTFIQRRKEYTWKSTSYVSELQFKETQQNDGGVFDVYRVNITQPEDKKIFLKDIVFDDALFCGRTVGRRVDENGTRKDYSDIQAVQRLELRTDNKSGTITTVQKDNTILTKDGYSICMHNLYGGFKEKEHRTFLEKSPTIRTAAGGGHIPSLLLSKKAIEYMDREVKGGRTHWDFHHHSDINNPKSVAAVANFFKGVPYNVLKDYDCIRYFHPIEVERLQTFDDNYTEGISNTQRYKCLGNSWTIDIISHIFENLKEK